MGSVGRGKKGILIVSAYPSQREDTKGKPFIDKEWRHFKDHLNTLGIDVNRDCIRTNAVICHTKTEPTDSQINACRPYLIKTIKKYNPSLIILLGDAAVKSLMGWLWKDEVGSLNRWAGFLIPNQKLNAWVLATYLPSDTKDDTLKKKILHSHLKTAIQKVGTRPWKEVPDYKSRVEIITNPSKAVRAIISLGKRTRCLAFDYECTCLKPEYGGAKIVSCSICFDNKETIAFPFTDSMKKPFIDLIRKPAGKIASNIKFEERWTKYHLKTRVRNWYWDTMIAAHVIDNRKSTTSLKFQSAILLGMESYDDHIKPFLRSGENKLNRINEIDMRDLLMYNGLDSLLEYKVAMIQIKLLNRKG